MSFSLLAARYYCHAGPMNGMAADRCIDNAISYHRAMHNGDVFPLHRTRLQLAHQVHLGADSFCDDH